MVSEALVVVPVEETAGRLPTGRLVGDTGVHPGFIRAVGAYSLPVDPAQSSGHSCAYSSQTPDKSGSRGDWRVWLIGALIGYLVFDSFLWAIVLGLAFHAMDD
jgi:hypothetical protein